MGEGRPRHLIFDAGALVALENRDARVVAPVEEARRRGRPIAIAATVLAEVWCGGRGRPFAIAHLLKRGRTGLVDVAPIDELVAGAVGLLGTASGHHDVPDGHVAHLSRLHGRAPVVTQDPDDIARFGRDIPNVRA